jgi:hypothetical protein
VDSFVVNAFAEQHHHGDNPDCGYCKDIRTRLRKMERIEKAARIVDLLWPRNVRRPSDPQSGFTEALNDLSAALDATDAQEGRPQDV